MTRLDSDQWIVNPQTGFVMPRPVEAHLHQTSDLQGTVSTSQLADGAVTLAKLAAEAKPITDFFYTGGFTNGTATSFTEILTQNSVGTLAYNYTMLVVAVLGHGANGAANTVTWQVRDESGANINYKGVHMDVLTDWAVGQVTNDRIVTTVIGKKDYAANATCGFRLAYKVTTSNVYADIGVHAQLARR